MPDVTRVTGRETGWDPWSAVDFGVDARPVLRAALARLKPEEREVLRLVAWEDLTAADAARVLGLPSGSAPATARPITSVSAWTWQPRTIPLSSRTPPATLNLSPHCAASPPKKMFARSPGENWLRVLDVVT